MTLTRLHKPNGWTLAPWRHATAVRDELDRFFQDFSQVFHPPFNLSTALQLPTGWLPAVDLYESKENLTVVAEVPGLKKEEIGISLHDGFLALTGERKAAHAVEGAKVARTERTVGRFHREISLPCKVNADRINATYTDGVLTVVLPKAEEAKPKQIKVNFN